MCKALELPRSSYYYEGKERKSDTAFENAVIEEFHKSRDNYGTRKLKIRLSRRKNPIIASRRRIRNAMRKYNLISKYTLKHGTKKGRKDKVNRDEVPNIVGRDFSCQTPLNVVVSDLTYIKVAGKWHYICVLLDLYNRKIIGSAVGGSKSSAIVKKAFFSVQSDLRRINIFHTDRGGEFKNYVIEEILDAFGIKRSLSPPGSPTDNAVAEATYNIIKTEFAFGKHFVSMDELEIEWFSYVNWYNNERIHGTLGYLSPNDFGSLSSSSPS